MYEDICTDGQLFYFIDADALKKNRTRDTVTYPLNDYQTGVIYPTNPVPPSSDVLPFNAGGM